MKLLGSTKCKITKYENGENVPDLEISEVVLIHCNVVNKFKIQESCIHLFLINHLIIQLLHISLKNFIFSKKIDSEFSYIEVWLANKILGY